MLRNYLKVAWRNIIRHKTYSIINIFGLALGICACLVIYVIASHEFNFDTFHPDKERIYRLVGRVKDRTGRIEMVNNVPPPLPLVLQRDISGIENAAGFHLYNAKVSIPESGTVIREFNSKWEIIVADSSYFHIFQYKWLAGNAATSFDKPYSVVLTEKKARKYFGDIPFDEMIGRWVVYDDSLKVTVAGILKDWDKNTDFGFTDFISVNTAKKSFLNKALSLDDWSDHVPHTSIAFIKLAKGVRPDQIVSQLSLFCKQHVALETGTAFSMQLQPLSNVHFNTDYPEYPFRKADLPILYVLMGIAAFILMIAAFNFINLSTAQSIQRVKEFGVRKVLGSSRATLILQHLSETFLVTVFAVCVSLVLLKPAMTFFQGFIPEGASLQFLSPATLTFVASLVLATSLLAGLYPAKVISAYLPVDSLKGVIKNTGSGKLILRKILIVFQFTISLVFIIGAIVLDSQLHFMQNKELGFSTNSIITVHADNGESISKVRFLADRIKGLNGIEAVALQSFEPMSDMSLNVLVRQAGAGDKKIPAMLQNGDNNFLPLYQIKLLAGRNLHQSDSLSEVVINEALMKQLGFKKPDDAISKLVYMGNSARPLSIAGVVADYHEHSFQETIRPLLIADMPVLETSIAVRLYTDGKNFGDVKSILAGIEQEWKSVYTRETFEYSFLDDAIAILYKRDRDIATLMNAAMLTALFISCIGLFGLAMFAGVQRTKEIGIRKVMGASFLDIITLLTKDFIVLVLLAFTIAAPIAWFLFNKWLQEFAYRISISWWIFVVAGLGSVVIAMVTVGYQAVKAAVANPVGSMKAE
jgi:putative ABC transport system permease protein